MPKIGMNVICTPWMKSNQFCLIDGIILIRNEIEFKYRTKKSSTLFIFWEWIYWYDMVASWCLMSDINVNEKWFSVFLFSLSLKYRTFYFIVLILEGLLHISFGTAKMRFIHFTIVVCILPFSFQNGSCSFIGDAFRQGFNTAIGFIKDIPKKIPTPTEIFDFGKNILIGLPGELTINVIHEFCE